MHKRSPLTLTFCLIGILQRKLVDSRVWTKYFLSPPTTLCNPARINTYLRLQFQFQLSLLPAMLWWWSCIRVIGSALCRYWLVVLVSSIPGWRCCTCCCHRCLYKKGRPSQISTTCSSLWLHGIPAWKIIDCYSADAYDICKLLSHSPAACNFFCRDFSKGLSVYQTGCEKTVGCLPCRMSTRKLGMRPEQEFQ